MSPRSLDEQSNGRLTYDEQGRAVPNTRPRDERLADRLAALLKLGIPKNMTYTRSEISAVISELRGES